MLTAAIACVILAPQSAPAREYKAKLGQPYLVGVIGRVSGSNERLEIMQSRLVTLKSVRTAIAVGTKAETIVAREGKKLVVFTANIKNPEKGQIYVTSSGAFGLRVFDTQFKAGDVEYRGSYTMAMGDLAIHLKPGQSVDIVSVYEFPAVTPHLRVGVYYDTKLKSDPLFDLTNLIDKPISVFAKDNMTYSQTANVKVGEAFDLDGRTMKVLGCKPYEGGFAVQVEVANSMLAGQTWGWQYARATMRDAGGTETAFYPDFAVLPEFAEWRNEIKPGGRIVGEYRFYPSNKAAPVSFALEVHATKRRVLVTGF